MASRRTRRWVFLVATAGVFVALVANTGWWDAVLSLLFRQEDSVVGTSLLVLVAEHLQLVLVSSGLTVVVGVPLGVWVTRRSGADFLPVVADFTSLGQTFPPVAVLALAAPTLGFGALPTIVALFLYGLLPVVRNTIAGMRSVPVHVLDAARGMGMGAIQALARVELPLAAHAILAGVRVSVVINIGTAMIGPVIGAGGLGSPIIAGLGQDNLAYIIEGAVPAALLALLADQFLANVEDFFYYPAGGH